MDTNIAVGTKIFTRVNKLERLLNSVPEWVSTVYIADDGKPTEEKSLLYDRDYQFELNILDLPYDAGLGAGREAIIDNLTEDYILIVDPDHRIPRTARILYDQLVESPNLGGIGGALAEPKHNRLYCEAQDFQEETTSGGTKLVRGPRVKSKRKKIELVAGAPLVRFDFIPNVALFRAICLHDQSWDKEYVIEGEHVDFYVAHWRWTDWEFAISPSVQFPHYPGGDTEYLLNRNDTDKAKHSRDYFLDKWGYVEDDVREWSWIQGGSGQDTDAGKIHTVVSILRKEGPKALYLRIRQFLQNRI
jgi:hypothetical protein